MKRKVVLLLLGTALSAPIAMAQSSDDYRPGRSKFMIRGYGHSGIEVTDESSSFVGGSFNPIFLWQQSDRLLFESELSFALEGEATELELEYANMSYILNKSATLRLGKFFVPFGIFQERIHPAWINRLPTAPLGFGHHNPVGPATSFGLELRGAIPVGLSKITYSGYVVNGPALNDGSVDHSGAGSLVYDEVDDNNKNKSVGGRLGVFPFSDLSLELGVSGMFGKVGTQDTKYENIGASLYAFDLTYVRTVPLLKGVIDVRGQLSSVSVDDAIYPEPLGNDKPSRPVIGSSLSKRTGTFNEDGGAFDNISTSFFGQLSYRPSFVENTLISQLEFVGRYSELNHPNGADWSSSGNQVALGINYWLDWRTVIKVAYHINDQASNGEDTEGGHSAAEDVLSNTLSIHWAIGF
jgi:hypothetical protein